MKIIYIEMKKYTIMRVRRKQENSFLNFHSITVSERRQTLRTQTYYSKHVAIIIIYIPTP